MHIDYILDYGFALEGLVRNHGIDALDFNKHVDDALPLEKLLSPDPGLRSLLQDIDKTKVKLWLFTNAYVTHGERVVSLLGVDDQFEGITYCDYGAQPLRCKPHEDVYFKAMEDAGIKDPERGFFVDDSAANCREAEKLEWTTVHFLEEYIKAPEEYVCRHRVEKLEELRGLFPEFFQGE
jgi:pyrimidine and pyridine-specific 5'-nucleotidase